MPFTRRLGWAGLLLLALAFRLPGLFGNSFHADEALYASWARLIHAGHDPWLQTVLVDKPPLLFYLQAAIFPLFAPVEWAARLPNWLASLLLIPLTARLARQLYRTEVAAWGAAVVAVCSPYLIQFSPTAFTDPLLVMLVVAALALRLDGRPGWSGLAWGLAMAAKHQAFFFLPLLLLWRPTTTDPRPTPSSLVAVPGSIGADPSRLPARRSFPGQAIARLLLGALPVVLLLLLWEGAQGGSNSLAAAWASFGGLRLAWSWELWPRLAAWASMLPLLISAPWLGTTLVAFIFGYWLLVIGNWLLVIGRGWFVVGRSSLVVRRWSLPRNHGLLALFVLAYGLFHWLVAVPVWDRFLLPLAPLTAVLVGGLLVQPVVVRWRPRPPAVGLIALLLILLPGALLAANGRYPLGGVRTADQGAAQVAHFLADAPYGTVLYDHWYGWQWRYHLFDSRVYVSWFAHPDGLVEDLTVFATDEVNRYLALPAGDGRLPVERAVYAGGFMLELVFTAVDERGQPTIYLYQVRAPSDKASGEMAP
jgi:hypothetical protein